MTALSHNWGLPPCQLRAALGSLRTSNTQRHRSGWTEEGEENGAPREENRAPPERDPHPPSPVPQPLRRIGLSPGQARPRSEVQPLTVRFLELTPPVNPAGLGGSPPSVPQVPSSEPRGSCPGSCRSQPSRGPARRQRVSPAWSPYPPALPRGTEPRSPEWGCGPSRRPPAPGRRTPARSSGRPVRGRGGGTLSPGPAVAWRLPMPRADLGRRACCIPGLPRPLSGGPHGRLWLPRAPGRRRSGPGMRKNPALCACSRERHRPQKGRVGLP